MLCWRRGSVEAACTFVGNALVVLPCALRRYAGNLVTYGAENGAGLALVLCLNAAQPCSV